MAQAFKIKGLRKSHQSKSVRNSSDPKRIEGSEQGCRPGRSRGTGLQGAKVSSNRDGHSGFVESVA